MTENFESNRSYLFESTRRHLFETEKEFNEKLLNDNVVTLNDLLEKLCFYEEGDRTHRIAGMWYKNVYIFVPETIDLYDPQFAEPIARFLYNSRMGNIRRILKRYDAEIEDVPDSLLAYAIGYGEEDLVDDYLRRGFDCNTDSQVANLCRFFGNDAWADMFDERAKGGKQ